MGTYGLSCIGNNHEQIRIDPHVLEPHVPIPRPISRRDDKNEIDFGIAPISFCTSFCGFMSLTIWQKSICCVEQAMAPLE